MVTARDEQLVVIDITGTSLKAGIGFSDEIVRGPRVDLPLLVGIREVTDGGHQSDEELDEDEAEDEDKEDAAEGENDDDEEDDDMDVDGEDDVHVDAAAFEMDDVVANGTARHIQTRADRDNVKRALAKTYAYFAGGVLDEEIAADAEKSAATADLAPLQIVNPVATEPFEVVDWDAFEALVRHALYVVLGLPDPPTSHPVVVCVPPDTRAGTMDELHQLFFERLDASYVLVETRPNLALLAANIETGTAFVVDIGGPAEATTVSSLVESRCIPYASEKFPINEAHLDDWLKYKLLQENPRLLLMLDPKKASWTAREVNYALDRVVASLKDNVDPATAIQADAALPHHTASMDDLFSTDVSGMEEDNGSGGLDIARLIAENKVDDIVQKGGSNRNAAAQQTAVYKIRNPIDSSALVTVDVSTLHDIVRIPHPLVKEWPPIPVGAARHSYFDPLFNPQLLKELTQPSGLNRLLGFSKKTYPDIHYGLDEAVAAAVSRIPERMHRALVYETFVVVSSAKAAQIRSIGNAVAQCVFPHVPSVHAVHAPYSVPLARQPRYVRVPDYFSELRDKAGATAVYLGGCILGKLAIADPADSLFISRHAYAHAGPIQYRYLPADDTPLPEAV